MIFITISSQQLVTSYNSMIATPRVTQTTVISAKATTKSTTSATEVTTLAATNRNRNKRNYRNSCNLYGTKRCLQPE